MSSTSYSCHNRKPSSDHGRTFGPVQSLEGDLDSVANPAPQMVVSDGSDVYVVWTSNLFHPISDDTSSFDDELDTVRTHLFFTASHDHGQHFDPLLRFDWQNDYSINARIAADGEKVFVVCVNSTATFVPSGDDLSLKFSNDRGETFGDALVIDDDLGSPTSEVRPDIDTSDGRLYISWWQSKEPAFPSDVII